MATECSPSSSGIHETGTDITIKVVDLEDGKKIAKQILANPSIIARIRAVDIDLSEEEEAANEEITTATPNADAASDTHSDGEADATSEKSNGSNDSNSKPPNIHFDKNYVDTKMNEYCAPLIQILNAIEASGAGLESFTWTYRTGWWDTKGTRPKEFWTALWKHARTLRRLDFGFYTHETHKVAPALVHFPVLKELRIDASTAHGDEGDVIEHLLQSSPALEVLDFDYPGCDLDTCQIQGISWDYTFPRLRKLSVHGYDFAPKAYRAFLERCTNVEVLSDAVDGYGNQSEDGSIFLSDTALPKLRALHAIQGSAFSPMQSYFSPTATRRIQHLALAGYGLSGYSVIANAAESLKVLEFPSTNATDWRLREPDSEEEDEERVEREEQERRDEGLSRRAKALKDVLPMLPALQELGIRMDSFSVTVMHEDGSTSHPRAMGADDLKLILSLLPSQAKIRALRLWDEESSPLPQPLLDDFPSCPESLQYLCWETGNPLQRILYKLDRRDGKTRAVQCDELRERGKEWYEQTVLES